ncbi:hypothetical protein AVEN_236226-1 [Araneus ventricosus]|uniref:Uncharacterized protein n=1 Tax=Araneus ventricosus TaxID=182803 RepID=A0A4Y2CCF9_ARAVE|nr:hypothetical protein AVEN_236226-1 [Araneus ventricosus]
MGTFCRQWYNSFPLLTRFAKWERAIVAHNDNADRQRDAETKRAWSALDKCPIVVALVSSPNGKTSLEFSQYFQPELPLTILSDHDEISASQVVWLLTVALATGYVREDPFRIGGIRRKSGFYFVLGASFRREKSSLGFAAVARSFLFGTMYANVTDLYELLPIRNGFPVP